MAGPRMPKSLAQQVAEAEDRAPQDFDPEEDGAYASESSEPQSDIEAQDTYDGREHYVDVGQSKLRKREGVSLGPRYEGSRVSRHSVRDDDAGDDPFSKGFDEESSEGEAPQTYRTHKRDTVGEDRETDFDTDEHTLEASAREGRFEEQDDTSATEMSGNEDDEDDEDEDTDVDEGVRAVEGPDRDELRKLMAEEQKTVAATISQAAKADAEKGQAVKAQRTTFDSLLNTRIRLQKALIAINSLPTNSQTSNGDGQGLDAMHAAEAAAMQLWSSLNDLRETLRTAHAGSKRKRTDFDESSSSASLWAHMRVQEAEALPHRQAILEKWSAKARGVTALPLSRKLNNTAAQQTIVDVITTQLADSDRLVKRTRIPRSCAPVQANAGVTESADIYDDADFYGVLLKELLERRSEDTTSALNGLSFQAPHWQAAREAKTKKVVDTKASKGRKLRYTVHEKLQNFMASEDRGSWPEKQVDQLFGSLLGRSVGLEEDATGDQNGVDHDEVDAADNGLMLFRN